MQTATYSLALLIPILTTIAVSSSLQEQMDRIASLQEHQIQTMLTNATVPKATIGVEDLETPQMAAIITNSLSKLPQVDINSQINMDIG